jgi:hypothetical protein
LPYFLTSLAVKSCFDSTFYWVDADIWHSPISVSELPASLLADSLLQKQRVDTGFKTLRKKLLNIGEYLPSKTQH